jgi:F-type H+-transporting ATPase subunit delta
MKNPKLSDRYAKSLFDFAGERNQIEEVYGDLTLLANTLKENRELQMLLRNPVVPPNQKHQIFESVFNGTLHEITYQFVDLLLRKKREPDLDSICECFSKLYNQAHNVKTAHITTAQPLSEKLKSKIVSLLSEQTHATIKLKESVEPSILGGFVIQVDDYFLDTSVLTKINKLKQEFSQNSFQVQF